MLDGNNINVFSLNMEEREASVTHHLTEAERDVKGFEIKEISEVHALFACGVIQALHEDYEVTTTGDGVTVSWIGRGLENIGLRVGDTFIIIGATKKGPSKIFWCIVLFILALAAPLRIPYLTDLLSWLFGLR